MMVFMGAVAIWHGLAVTSHLAYEKMMPSDVYFSVPDKAMLIAMAAVFVVINFIFVVLIIYRVRIYVAPINMQALTPIR
jgi:hypothetical protein